MAVHDSKKDSKFLYNLVTLLVIFSLPLGLTKGVVCTLIAATQILKDTEVDSLTGIMRMKAAHILIQKKFVATHIDDVTINNIPLEDFDVLEVITIELDLNH